MVAKKKRIKYYLTSLEELDTSFKKGVYATIEEASLAYQKALTNKLENI